MFINVQKTTVFWSLYLFVREDNKQQATHKGIKLPTLFDHTERPGPSFGEPWPYLQLIDESLMGSVASEPHTANWRPIFISEKVDSGTHRFAQKKTWIETVGL